MNVKVYWDGNNISDDVISYARIQTLCDGVGTFTFEVKITTTATFSPWDTILLYEDDNKKGTYYITDITESVPNSTITVDCQDGSKRLSDYFITDSYFIDYPTYTRYWIELFLIRQEFHTHLMLLITEYYYQIILH